MPILFLKAHPAVQGGHKPRTIEDRLERLAQRHTGEKLVFLAPGEPTAEQARSGEYKKVRETWRGQAVRIESPAGSVRRGTNRLGITWEQRILFDYGEFVGTKGVDGDPVDVFFGSSPDAAMVYVVHQRRINDWEQFDEDKCMVDFPDEESAKAAFLSCYSDPRFLGPITAMPVEEFIGKLRATRDRPAMIKALLLIKAHVGAYLRHGKLVNLVGYQGRQARARMMPGQVVLFGHRQAEEPSDRERRALAAFQASGDGTELSNEAGTDHVILLPDASNAGKYRYQTFNARGFYTHSTFDTAEEAVRDAARKGYHRPNPGILDRLASADEWAQGA